MYYCIFDYFLSTDEGQTHSRSLMATALASSPASAATAASPWLLYQRLYPGCMLPPPLPSPLMAAGQSPPPPPPPVPTTVAVSPFQLAIQSLIAHGQRMIAKQQEELLRNLQPLDKDKCKKD